MPALLFSYARGGGMVTALIFVVAVVVAYVGVGKALQLWCTEYHRRAVMRRCAVGGGVATLVGQASVWRELIGEGPFRGAAAQRYYRNRLREVLLALAARLDAGLDTMAAWVSVAPLLGLLGTVVGMIRTFAIIMEFGVGNPALLSEGISVSLLTTEAGLLVAFPGLLFHAVLDGQRVAVIRRMVADGERLVALLCEEARRAR